MRGEETMHPLVKAFEEKQIAKMNEKVVPAKFRAGDTVKVVVQVEEKGKKWTQTCEGICIRKVNKGIASTFVVRRIAYSAAVEMRFPIWTHTEVLRRGKVRRANLRYLRNCSRKEGRIEDLRSTHGKEN